MTTEQTMAEWRWNVIRLVEALTDLETQPNNLLILGYIQRRSDCALRAISAPSESLS